MKCGKKQEAEQKKLERENAAIEKAQKKAMAEQQTLEAIKQLEMIDNTLLYTLEIDDRIDWDSLKDRSNFTDPKPVSPLQPIYPTEPVKEFFEPKFGLWDKVSTSSKQKK